MAQVSWPETVGFLPNALFFIRSHFNSSDVRASDLGFTRIPFGDEEALRAAVALVGPVSVVLDAEHFADYKSGGCFVSEKKVIFVFISLAQGFSTTIPAVLLLRKFSVLATPSW